MRWFSTTCMLSQVPERNLREQGSRQSGDSNTQGIFLLVLLSILLSVVVFCWYVHRHILAYRRRHNCYALSTHPSSDCMTVGYRNGAFRVLKNLKTEIRKGLSL
jgi:hypothetical protein